MPLCPNCATEHPLLRHHLTGHLEPDNCIKAPATPSPADPKAS